MSDVILYIISPPPIIEALSALYPPSLSPLHQEYLGARSRIEYFEVAAARC
jgi:hypothetical protein